MLIYIITALHNFSLATDEVHSIKSQHFILASLATLNNIAKQICLLCFSLSKQYSRYRSAQRALARQMYLRKRLRLQPYKRLHSIRLAHPVRPRQRSFYHPRRARVRPENLALDEYDHSINEWAKKGHVTKHTRQSKHGSGIWDD